MSKSSGSMRWENGRWELDVHYEGNVSDSIDGLSSKEIEAETTGNLPGELAAALLLLVFRPRDGSDQPIVDTKSANDEGVPIPVEMQITLLRIGLANAHRQLYRAEIARLKRLRTIVNEARKLIEEEEEEEEGSRNE